MEGGDQGHHDHNDDDADQIEHDIEDNLASTTSAQAPAAAGSIQPHVHTEHNPGRNVVSQLPSLAFVAAGTNMGAHGESTSPSNAAVTAISMAETSTSRQEEATSSPAWSTRMVDRAASAIDSIAAGSNPFDDSLFPSRLYAMLNDANDKNFASIVSWGVDDSISSFKVHDKEAFERQILPQYFKMTKYKSFTRQLHNYDFEWIRKGRDKGGYKNRALKSDDPNSCVYVVRRNAVGSNAESLRFMSQSSAVGSMVGQWNNQQIAMSSLSAMNTSPQVPPTGVSQRRSSKRAKQTETHRVSMTGMNMLGQRQGTVSELDRRAFQDDSEIHTMGTLPFPQGSRGREGNLFGPRSHTPLTSNAFVFQETTNVGNLMDSHSSIPLQPAFAPEDERLTSTHQSHLHQQQYHHQQMNLQQGSRLVGSLVEGIPRRPESQQIRTQSSPDFGGSQLDFGINQPMHRSLSSSSGIYQSSASSHLEQFQAPPVQQQQLPFYTAADFEPRRIEEMMAESQPSVLPQQGQLPFSSHPPERDMTRSRTGGRPKDDKQKNFKKV